MPLVGRAQRAARRVDVVERLDRRGGEGPRPALVQLGHQGPPLRRRSPAPPAASAGARRRPGGSVGLVGARVASGRSDADAATAADGGSAGRPASGAGRAGPPPSAAATHARQTTQRGAPRAGGPLRPRRPCEPTRSTAPDAPAGRPARRPSGAGRGRRPGTWWVSSVRGPRPVRPGSASGDARDRQPHRLGAAGVPQVERERRRGAAVVRIGGQPAADRPRPAPAGASGASSARSGRNPSAATARVSAGVAAFQGATPVSAWKAAAAIPNTSDAGPGAPPRATVGST